MKCLLLGILSLGTVMAVGGCSGSDFEPGAGDTPRSPQKSRPFQPPRDEQRPAEPGGPGETPERERPRHFEPPDVPAGETPRPSNQPPPIPDSPMNESPGVE